MDFARARTFAAGAALAAIGGALLVRALTAAEEPEPARVQERNPDATVPYGAGERIEKAFTINRPPHELYAYWRDFTNLPAVMSYLERVDVDGLNSHWVTKAPAGTKLSWDAEIIADHPDEMIAWRSIGGQVRNAGSVRFAPAPGERGTELRVEIEYVPPAGALGAAYARLFPDNAAHQLESDLRRFKSMMEAGDIALNGTDVKA